MGRRAIELNAAPTAETAPPEEAGGEGSQSLFDASGDARVRILRRDERTQKMVTHGYMEPTVSEEMVSMRFGGGHYRAQLFVPDGEKGIPTVKRSRDFDIPGPYKPPTKINTYEEAGPNAPRTDNGAIPAGQILSSGGGDDLMQVLKAGIINTLLEMMKSTKDMNSRPVPTTDPLLLEFLKSQASAQTAMQQSQQDMMKFMLTLATKDGGDRKEILAEMLKYKELFAPAAGGAPPVNQMEMLNTMLETFSRMRDVASDIAPPADTDPIMGSIPKLVEVVAEQHQMQKQARLSTVPTPAPQGGIAHMPVVNTLPPQPPPALWQQILRQQSARIVAAAVAKGDADALAGTAIMFAPPHVLEALKLFFHRDEADIVADVLTEIPVMADHREWLVEFVESAQFRLFPDEFAEETEGEEPKGGDT